MTRSFLMGYPRVRFVGRKRAARCSMRSVNPPVPDSHDLSTPSPPDASDQRDETVRPIPGQDSRYHTQHPIYANANLR